MYILHTLGSAVIVMSRALSDLFIITMNESIMDHQLRTISNAIDVGKWLCMMSWFTQTPLSAPMCITLYPACIYTLLLILLYTFRFFLNENLKKTMKKLEQLM